MTSRANNYTYTGVAPVFANLIWTSLFPDFGVGSFGKLFEAPSSLS
jgi:hypothetical protein